MRELLKEVREWINDAAVNHKGMQIQCEVLLRRIDSALSAPEPDAMEAHSATLVEMIRAYKHHATSSAEWDDWLYTDSEAAALITNNGCRAE